MRKKNGRFVLMSKKVQPCRYIFFAFILVYQQRTLRLLPKIVRLIHSCLRFSVQGRQGPLDIPIACPSAPRLTSATLFFFKSL